MEHIEVECLYDQLFCIIQNDWQISKVLSLINKQFNSIVNRILDDFFEIMNVPLDFKTRIAYFCGRDSQDNIEYLVGVSKLLSKMDYKAEEELGKNIIDFDNYGSKREYCPVIMSNILPGINFGSDRIRDINYGFDLLVKYYRDEINQKIMKVKSEYETESNIKNDNKNRKYWLYVLELDCYYSKTYTYIILPFKDNSLKTYYNQTVKTVYDIILDKNFEIFPWEIREDELLSIS